jgi:diguanylate cyclase
MHYPEDLFTAADYLKKAVPYMVKNRIPANPVNYTLWYHYVANNIPTLNEELDEIITNQGSVSFEQSQELYQHYIISQHLQDHQKTLKGFTKLTAHLLTHIGQSMQGSEAFGDDLNENIERIKHATTAEDIAPIVENLIKTGENLINANSKFQSKMKSATCEINELREQLEQAEKHAYIDQLTQLYNRHAFDRQLKQLLQHEKIAENIYLVLFDLDHFKTFNDDYGHIIGDRVLKRMGELTLQHCPDNAIAARYGGEEFVIILNNSSEQEAAELAELLRQKIQQLRVKMKNTDKVLDNISASFGVAGYQLKENPESFIDRADKALYRAKHHGRNRVEIFSEELQEAL